MVGGASSRTRTNSFPELGNKWLVGNPNKPLIVEATDVQVSLLLTRVYVLLRSTYYRALVSGFIVLVRREEVAFRKGESLDRHADEHSQRRNRDQNVVPNLFRTSELQ